MQVYVPFKEWSIDNILDGKKKATSRYKKFGNLGDYFHIYTKTYFFDLIIKLPLWFVRNELYVSEGCYSPEDFESRWNDIHQKRGFRPNDEIWYHHFIEKDSNL